MTQTRLHSFVEAWANTVIGFVVALIAQYYLMHFYGYKISLMHDVQLALIFTVLSLVRSYCVRRFFNNFGGGK